MDEDQNSSVVEEVAPPDDESTVVSQDIPVETPAESTSVSEEEDKQERNWREMRKKQSELEQRSKAQEEFIQQLLVAQTQTQEQKPQPVAEETSPVDPNDFPTWGEVNKKMSTDAKKIARDTFMELEREREQQRFKERLQSRFSDFDNVVNADTIAIFEKEEPELAQTIADLKDPYKIGLQSYHYIKSKDYAKNVPAKRHAREVEKKLEESEKSVQSPQAYNKRPMAQAFEVTDAENSRIYDEMIKYARGAGYG